MSITPDSTREIGDSCCSKCGRLLLVNDQAIVHEHMRDGATFVLGTCCADTFMGAVLQDFAVLLSRQSSMGELLSTSSVLRLKRVCEAAQVISHEYDIFQEYQSLGELLNYESE
jgi:hypothetical protein